MKDRLIALFKEVGSNVTRYPTGNFLEYFADYLLANGVIVPPCKVWDSVFFIVKKNGRKEIEHGFVKKILVYKDSMSISGGMFTGDFFKRQQFFAPCENFGKTIFLTREEAERALKGGAE